MKNFPFYALILPLLPILTLQAANVNETPIGAGLRVTALILFITGAVWILEQRMGIQPNLAALLSSLFGLSLSIGSWVVSLIMFGLAVFMILIRKIVDEKFNRIGNLICGILLLYPLGTLATRAIPRDLLPAHHVSAASITSGPDVYFIVLDSYTGHTVLQDRFGYDDSAFLDGLRSLGFDVGECQSPAPITDQSLAATLNGGLVDAAGSDLWQYIRHSAVRSRLEAEGYRSYAYATGFVWSEIMDADVYLWPQQANVFSDFEIYYLKQSALGFLDWNHDWALRYRDRTNFILRTLPNIAAESGPKFIFAHIIPPHPPFDFAADGSLPDWSGMRNQDYLSDGAPEYGAEDYAAGYIDQVAYIGGALLPVIRQVLANSSQPPVIVIEGDHGAWYSPDAIQARDALCAVYAPFDIPLQPEHYFNFILETR